MSTSIGSRHWNSEVLPFTKKFITAINPAENGVHVALVTYSGTANCRKCPRKLKKRVLWNLLDSKARNLDQILAGYHELSYAYEGGITMTGAALDYVRTKVIFGPGSRNGVPKLLLVLTDGSATDSIDRPAESLKSEHIVVGVIGIQNARESECRKIAGCHPRTGKCPQFVNTDWGRVIEQANSIRKSVCKVLPTDATCAGWAGWSPCSATCGEGKKTRSRETPLQLAPPQPGSTGQMGMTCEQQKLKLIETQSCQAAVKCPLNARCTEWEDWSKCDVTCGAGEQSRSRRTETAAEAGGLTCEQQEGSTRQTRSCKADPCPVDAVPGDFSPFGPCSVTQGPGYQVSKRGPNKVEAQHGGRTLEQQGIELIRRKKCKLSECPVRAQCGEWGEWSDCSATCSEGVETRTRSPYNVPMAQHGGKTCEQQLIQKTETRVCTRPACFVPTWSEWTSCSATCGNGERRRHLSQPKGATKPPTEETEPCNVGECPVNARCGDFGPWSDCTALCGGGEQSRERIGYNNPPAQHGGESCETQKIAKSERRECNTNPCPIDAEPGVWNSWGDCSATCGKGTRQRTRGPAVAEEQHGGRTLDVQGIISEESEQCNIAECPINEECGEWSAWNECSATCNSGIRTRDRNPSRTLASNGGLTCVQQGHASTEEEACNPSPCPINAFPGEFGEWGDCSRTCGGGTRVRTRAPNLINEQHGGLSLEAQGIQTKETESCNTMSCIESCVTEWADWVECSATCGPANRVRHRSIRFESATAPCTEPTEEVESCDLEPCPSVGPVIPIPPFEEPTPLPPEEITPPPFEEPTPLPSEEITPPSPEEPTPPPFEEPTPPPFEEPTPPPFEEPTPPPFEEPTPPPFEEPTPPPFEEPTPLPPEEITPPPPEEPTVTPPEEPTVTPPVVPPPETPEKTTPAGTSGKLPQPETAGTAETPSTTGEEGGGNNVAVAGGVVGGLLLATGAGAGAFYFRKPGGGEVPSLPEFDEGEKLDQEVEIEEDEYAINVAGESDFWAAT